MTGALEDPPLLAAKGGVASWRERAEARTAHNSGVRHNPAPEVNHSLIGHGMGGDEHGLGGGVPCGWRDTRSKYEVNASFFDWMRWGG